MFLPWYATILVSGGVLLFLCCGCVLLMRICLLVVTVQGQSMSPTLEEGDRVLVLRLFWPHWVQKKRIVLFRQSPFDEAGVDTSLSLHIKRVVALAGESYKDSTALPRGQHEHVTPEGQAFPWHIPPQHIFVCGDNREQSIDSRSWGPLPLRNVRGVVVKKLSSSPVSFSAPVVITQRRIAHEQPDQFHVESY